MCIQWPFWIIYTYVSKLDFTTEVNHYHIISLWTNKNLLNNLMHCTMDWCNINLHSFHTIHISMIFHLACKSLSFVDVIWHERAQSTLVQVINSSLSDDAKPLLEPMLNSLQWRFASFNLCNFSENVQDIKNWKMFENYTFHITAISKQGQWIQGLLYRTSMQKWITNKV